jgi:hypothetical protein
MPFFEVVPGVRKTFPIDSKSPLISVDAILSENYSHLAILASDEEIAVLPKQS